MYAPNDSSLNSLDYLKSLTQYWDEINKGILESTKNLGQTYDSLYKSGTYSNVLSKNIQGAAKSLEKMGVGTKEVSAFMSAIADHTGTMAGFSEKAMKNYGALQKILGSENIDSTLTSLNDLGMGMTRSTELIEDMTKSSYKMGLNAVKVAKAMNTNFKAASNISFKGGSEDIAKMAKESVLFGIDMGDVLAKAKELRSPEQAIEFSQNMQMLGGDFANLFGDAFKVLHNARNDTKQFQKDIALASQSLITMNEATGKLEPLPENFDRAQLAAAQLGMDVETLLDTGRKMKKMNMLKDMFSGLSDEDANVISGLMNIEKGGKISLEGLDKLDTEALQKIGIQSTDQLKNIGELQKGQIESLVKMLKDVDQTIVGADDGLEKQLTSSQTFSEAVQNFKNYIQASNTSLLSVTETLNNIRKNFDTLNKEGVVTAVNDAVSILANGLLDSFKDSLPTLMSEIQKQIELELTESPETKRKKKSKSKEPDLGITTEETDEIEDQSDEENEVQGEEIPDLTGQGKKGGRIKAKKGKIVGGVFEGPSHENGGIPIYNKSKNELIEVEGGEAIINKNSTKLFAPLLSKINEFGGGIKFAEGGITSMDVDNIVSNLMSSSSAKNSSMDISVNVNGSLSIDGMGDVKLSREEKEKLTQNIKKIVLDEANKQFNQDQVSLGGKRKRLDNRFDSI